MGRGQVTLECEFSRQHQMADGAAGASHVHLAVIAERLLGAEPLGALATPEHA